MRIKRRVPQKVLAWLLAVVLILTGLPGIQLHVLAAGEQEVSGLRTEHELESGTYRLKRETSIFIFGDFHQDIHYKSITIKKNAEVTLTVSNNIGGDDAAEGKDSKPGILVETGATLNLYLDGNITIWGGNGWYFYSGKAGIEVQEGATLNIYGGGTLQAIGGNAGNGGTNTQYKPAIAGSSDKDQCNGGGGGGGAGAGIGGSGGYGGKAMSYYTWAHYFFWMKQGQTSELEKSIILNHLHRNCSEDIQDASDGGAGGNCGTVNINSSDVTIQAVGGQGGTAGAVDTATSEYQKGDTSWNSISWGLVLTIQGDIYGGTGQRGTGGGGYPAAGIGGGGGGAGAGGYGGYGGFHAHIKNPEVSGDFALGGGGGGGGGQGYVNGQTGIGGLGISFLRAARPGEAGNGTHGGSGAEGTKHDDHGRYDGMNGHDGGKGGESGGYEAIHINAGGVHATATKTDGIGVGSGASDATKKNSLQINSNVLLYANKINDAKTNLNNEQVVINEVPLNYTNNMTVNGEKVRSGAGTNLMCWVVGRRNTVQYDENGVRYEVTAIAYADGIQWGTPTLINPCTLTVEHSLLATGFIVKDEGGKKLTDLRSDLPGFQVENGKKISVEIQYPAGSDCTTSGWSDGTKTAVWTGSLTKNQTLTAVSKSQTGLPSYTVSLGKIDLQNAKVTLHIAYENITSIAKTLMIEPEGTDNGILTLTNTKDADCTMQIRMPSAQEINVLKDNDNPAAGQNSSYDKILVGEVLNPETIRAGSYTGGVSFLVSYGLETKELDLSKGDVTITGTGYKANGAAKETAFHGHYSIVQNENSTNHSVIINASTAKARDFRIQLNQLHTTGDLKVTSAENLEMSVNKSEMDSMYFDNVSNTSIALEGSNKLKTDKNTISLSNGDVSVYGYLIPNMAYLNYTSSMTGLSMNGWRYSGVDRYEAKVQNKQAAVTQAAFTAKNSNLELVMSGKNTTLELGSTKATTEISNAATGMILENTKLNVIGEGTIQAQSGRFYDNTLDLTRDLKEQYQLPSNAISSDRFPHTYLFEGGYNTLTTDIIYYANNPSNYPKEYSIKNKIVTDSDDLEKHYSNLSGEKSKFAFTIEEFVGYSTLFRLMTAINTSKNTRLYSAFPDGNSQSWKNSLNYKPYAAEPKTDNPAVSAVIVDDNSTLTLNGTLMKLDVHTNNTTVPSVPAIGGNVTVKRGVESEEVMLTGNSSSSYFYIRYHSFTNSYVYEDKQKWSTGVGKEDLEKCMVRTHFLHAVSTSSGSTGGTVILNNGAAMTLTQDGKTISDVTAQYNLKSLVKNGGKVNGQ